MSQLDDALRQQFREAALTVPCPLCRAAVGQPCRNPKSGYVLVKQPAHHPRLQDAGVFPRGGSDG